MRQPQDPNSSTPQAGKGLPPDAEAKKKELIQGLEAGTVELRPFYFDLRNKIVRPWETVQTTHYFWRRWVPVLGPTYTVVIINFRLLCADCTSSGSDGLVVSHADLAEVTGISLPSIKRILGPKAFRAPETWFLPLFLQPYQRYTYDRQQRKKVRAPNGYQVAMDDPLLPEDKEALRGLYAEEEIRRLVKEGVVDIQKYAELRSEYPPKDQIDTQVKDIAITGEKSNHKGRIQSPKDQIDTASSSSSSLTTATTTPRHLLEPRHTTTKNLVTEIVEKFDGHISDRTASRLIEKCGFDNVREQLKCFDYRDNSWADKGPSAAFVTYCRDRPVPPEAYEKKLQAEERKRQEERVWRAMPIEEKLESLLSRWEELYHPIPAPRGESNDPFPDEVEAATQRFLRRLQKGVSKEELFASIKNEIAVSREAKKEAVRRYEQSLGQALSEYREELLEVEMVALTEEVKRRALEKGGDFVRKHMPKPLLEAIERDILCERVKKRSLSWPEFWQSVSKKME